MDSFQKITLLALLWCCCHILHGQIDDCMYNQTVSGTPSDESFLVEHKLVSSHKIETLLPIQYGAEYEICLDTGFYINTGATLIAEIDGCVAECLPASQVCDQLCSSPLNDTTTSKGQRYVKFEVVITFPETVDNISITNCNSGYTTIKSCLDVDGIIYSIGDTLVKHFPEINSTAGNLGELKRCLCDKNVFLYTNDNLILEEGGIAQRNKSSGGIKEEGGVYSLNYILEYLEPLIPDTVLKSNVMFEKKGVFPKSEAPIVAILDSGLNPDHVPLKSLYFDHDMTHSVCPLNDTSGWNFVDNNNDLFDDRGHGTLVSLSYFHALNNLRPSVEVCDQSMLTVKVLNSCGEGTTYSTICGLRYAELKGATVINASWGMYQNERQLQRTVEDLNNKNIFIVTSAGNAALDLDESPHFPSGYSTTFDYIKEDESTVEKPGMKGVLEVGGMCRYIDASCDFFRRNSPLISNSNYRDLMFVEASKGIENLLPLGDRPSCEIEGTSYAAPQLAAGVIHRLMRKQELTKEKLWSDSKSIHPDNEYRSYLLNNCK